MGIPSYHCDNGVKVPLFHINKAIDELRHRQLLTVERHHLESWRSSRVQARLEQKGGHGEGYWCG